MSWSNEVLAWSSGLLEVVVWLNKGLSTSMNKSPSSRISQLRRQVLKIKLGQLAVGASPRLAQLRPWSPEALKPWSPKALKPTYLNCKQDYVIHNCRYPLFARIFDDQGDPVSQEIRSVRIHDWFLLGTGWKSHYVTLSSFCHQWHRSINGRRTSPSLARQRCLSL